MSPSTSTPRTIGFISTWPVYQGATIDRHAHVLMKGICAAARDQGCRLLLAAGVSAVAERGAWRTVWPVQTEGAEFVPVGPWNTDGLIIVPDSLSDVQWRYVQDLQASGFPVMFTTPEAPGPRVTVDNDGGIREAVRHLAGHGHRRIAFIAGTAHRGGDSAERLHAYRRGLAEAGLDADERLIAYGEHRFDGGHEAMRRLIDDGQAFTAFVASNDLSCLGAIDALLARGRSVPKDVAAIGFDDILDARSHRPSLTTVRHPTFALGYEIVLGLLARIAGRSTDDQVIVPTRLIVRESCGCRRDQEPQVDDAAGTVIRHAEVPVDGPASLARQMAEAAFGEASHSTLDQLEEQCQAFIAALVASAHQGDEGLYREGLAVLLSRTEQRGEDAHVWQPAVSALYRRSSALLGLAGADRPGWLLGLLDQARLEISEQVQRQATRALLEHMDMMTELGLLTARLPSALGVAESASILREHLPRLGIDRFLVATYLDDADDPGATCQVLLSVGLGTDGDGLQFRSRAFPPRHLFPEDEPVQLIVLPLPIDDGLAGFMAMSATNLELPAAIVNNLATAMRGGRLYLEAVNGRRQAEEANLLKSRFLSMVSHELRTPLSVVVGLSDMVLREARQAGPTSPGIVRDLEKMAASAEHLGRLIGDVLDLASSGAGQLRLVRQPLDLAEVLGPTVLAGEQMAREKGLAWHASVPSDGPWVMGDQTRLRQVVLNVISNAVKFTDAGGIDLRVDVDDEAVTISISDTGRGIPQTELERVFDEFHRGANLGQSGPGGLGLGLAIARQLAQHHGGRLEVRSPGPSGVGSTFVFRLPVLAPTPTPVPGPLVPDERDLDSLSKPLRPSDLEEALARRLGPPASARTPRILVVDDDPDVRDLHARVVREAGGEAIVASTGREALLELENLRPDLVLLDLGMPDVDGFDLLATMRARARTQGIPVIVITGQVLTDDDLERLNRGVSTILSKGVFTVDETIARIDAALAGRRGLGSPTQRLVRRAIAFIDGHFSEPLSRDDIARHVAISSDYLTDCFHQELGITPITYLNRRRLREARELLDRSDDAITTVALAVGFSDISHFTRTFHREVGVSPRAYRRRRT